DGPTDEAGDYKADFDHHHYLARPDRRTCLKAAPIRSFASRLTHAARIVPAICRAASEANPNRSRTHWTLNVSAKASSVAAATAPRAGFGRSNELNAPPVKERFVSTSPRFPRTRVTKAMARA